LARSRFVGFDEKRHGEEIGRSAWTKPSGNEALMNRSGARAPAGSAHPAFVKKTPRRAARKPKTRQATAMQQIGILEGCDEGETCFDARGFIIVRGVQRAP
jgi:hypothetical protein